MTLSDLTGNKILLISATAWMLAQFFKVLLDLIQKKRISWHLFFSSGGMPSSHSAVVTALTASIAMIYGFGSVAFSISAILSFIVMYDAAGVRQSVGQQSTILNLIVKRSKLTLEKELREFIGHTPFQVFMGAVTGILTAWIWITITGP